MQNPTDVIEDELWKLFFPVPFSSNDFVKLDNAYDTKKSRIFEIWIQIIAVQDINPEQTFKVKVIGKYPYAGQGFEEITVFNDTLSIDVKKIGDIHLFTANKFKELSYFIYSSIRTLWRTRFESQ